MPPPSPNPAPAMTSRQRRLARIGTLSAMFLGVVDGAMFNMALPTIADSLKIDPAVSIWATNAYQLALLVTILPAAALSEVLGFRRLYLPALVLMLAATLVAAMAGSLPILVGARVAHGVGAAVIYTVNMALIRHVSEQGALGRLVSLIGVIVSAGATLGPAFAGGILQIAPWQMVFLAAFPFLAVTTYVCFRNVPRGEPRAGSYDFASALISVAALGALLMALNSIAHHLNWAVTAGFAVAAMAAGTLLVRRQIGMATPLLPIDLLRIRTFGVGMATSICAFVAQNAAFVTLPFHFQYRLGFDVAVAGVLWAPWPAAIGLSSWVAGRLLNRFPAVVLISGGLLVEAVTLALLGQLEPGTSPLIVAVFVALAGFGFGFFQVPNNLDLIMSAPHHRTASASGGLNLARTLGQAIGAALAALLLYDLAIAGTGTILVVAAGITLGAAIVSLLRGRRPTARE